MSRFLRTRLKNIAPYVPGEQPKNGCFVKLNTNESPFPPAPSVLAAAHDGASGLNRYSDPDLSDLKAAAAAFYGVPETFVTAGNGSDELLAFCFTAFLAGGEVAFPDVTYGFYRVLCALLGTRPRLVPLDQNLQVVAEDYCKLNVPVVLANPNAHTGGYLPPAAVEKIVASDRNRLVVIDEAYIDFGGESCVPLTRRYDNLIVVQTLSKSRALAGGRAGIAIACPQLIADMERVRNSLNPYNVGTLPLRMAAAAFADREYFKKCTEEICAARRETTDRLVGAGYKVFPSYGNFLLIGLPGADGETLYHKLRDKGFLVRRIEEPRVADYVRVTVGTQAEMRAFCDAAININGGSQ